MSAFVYSGDTYLTEALRDAAGHIPHLKTVFIECSYPNGMEDLAQRRRQLTPALQEGQRLDF